MGTTTLGSAIRHLREQADLSQEELAAKAQVSRASIQNWEGDRRQPRRAELRRLAAALRVSEADLKALAAGDQPNGNGDDSPEPDGDELQQLRAEIEELREEIKRLSVRKKRRASERDTQDLADTDG